MTQCARLVVLVACSVLAVGAAAAPSPQQQQSPEMKAIIAKDAEYKKYYEQKDYAGALKAADELLLLGRKARYAEAIAVSLYNKACVLALLGRPEAAVAAAREAVEAGFTDVAQFASDSDFASIRTHPDFVLLMKELREKYAPHPLDWDPARTVPAFPIMFDRPDDPQLVAMRREFDIDPVVAGASDDYARLRALTAWTSRQWPHSSNAMASKGDPVTILREAKAGGSFICRDYAIVAAGVARAYGLPARVLNLLPKDVESRSEAHSVAEVWLDKFGKWVLADGQYGTIGEIDGTPLNGVELQAAIARGDTRLRCSVGETQCTEWKAFIVRNMYFFKFAQDQRRFDAALGPQLVLVPKGAPDPHKFNGGTEGGVFARSVYVSDPGIFYRKP